MSHAILINSSTVYRKALCLPGFAKKFQLHTFYTLKDSIATIMPSATHSQLPCFSPLLPQPARSYTEARQMQTPSSCIHAACSRSRHGPSENKKAALRQTLTTFEVFFPASMTNLTASGFLLNMSSS